MALEALCHYENANRCQLQAPRAILLPRAIPKVGDKGQGKEWTTMPPRNKGQDGATTNVACSV